MPISVPPYQGLSRRSVLHLGSGIAAAVVTGTAMTGVMQGATSLSAPVAAPVTGPSGNVPSPSFQGPQTDHGYTTFPGSLGPGYLDETDCNALMYVFREPVISRTLKAAQLYSLYQPNWKDHFYTPDRGERDEYVGYGYQDLSSSDPMWVFVTTDPARRPPRTQVLRRLCHLDEVNTFYTASDTEAEDFTSNRGYKVNSWANDVYPIVFDTMAVVNGAATALWYRYFRPSSGSPALGCGTA